MASERVVKVTIAANVSDFKKKMDEAAQSTRTLGTEGEKLAQARQSFEQVGRAGVAMGAVLTAAIGVAVARFALTGPALLGTLLHHEMNNAATPLEDIERATTVLPEMLRDLHRSMEAKSDRPVDSAWVGLFGFPTGSTRTLSIQFTTEADYEPEDRFEGGNRFGVKPWGDNSFELIAPTSEQETIELATRIRADNDKRIAYRPCAIGGELYVTILNSWVTQTGRLHRFPDYDETRAAIEETAHVA